MKESLRQASQDHNDAVLGNLPAAVVAISAYVGSKLDTSHVVAQLSGQLSVRNLTADLSPLLTLIYNEHDMLPTEDLIVPLLLKNPVHNQRTNSRVLQRHRANHFWPLLNSDAPSLPTEVQAKLSRFQSIQTGKART